MVRTTKLIMFDEEMVPKSIPKLVDTVADMSCSTRFRPVFKTEMILKPATKRSNLMKLRNLLGNNVFATSVSRETDKFRSSIGKVVSTTIFYLQVDEIIAYDRRMWSKMRMNK